jgi:hypothetical protein
LFVESLSVDLLDSEWCLLPFEIFLLSVSLLFLEAEKSLEGIGQANRKVMGIGINALQRIQLNSAM